MVAYDLVVWTVSCYMVGRARLQLRAYLFCLQTKLPIMLVVVVLDVFPSRINSAAHRMASQLRIEAGYFGTKVLPSISPA